MHSFTTEDLLQYVYKEVSPEKAAEIRAALAIDWNLREELNLLAESGKQLNSIEFSPRQQSLDFILAYAEKAVEECSEPA